MNQDLNNLRNQYLDPISYLILIAESPKDFDPKTIKVILDNYKIMKLYLDIHEKSVIVTKILNKNINVKFDTMGYIHPSKIDPLYVSGLIMDLFATENDILFVSNISISNRIFDIVDNKVDKAFIDFGDNISDICDYIEDDSIVGKLLNIQYKDMNEFIGMIYKAYQIARLNDSELYDTNNYTRKYIKIIPYLKELTSQIKI